MVDYIKIKGGRSTKVNAQGANQQLGALRVVMAIEMAMTTSERAPKVVVNSRTTNLIPTSSNYLSYAVITTGMVAMRTFRSMIAMQEDEEVLWSVKSLMVIKTPRVTLQTKDGWRFCTNFAK
ncbi:hypothetical protein SARC_06051 [Sphaeroforma arctica JP610]|uniref:Uncharacterized protein n=1 Tax=Sphaeroforma arctica JP610 TaxID=667725 RepID=A0A0L0G0A8_9EUKA|nr:hypothetical protein SARC_06051 [Sphaeroforma arctica JP610]KNC81628.1 hypothetical protein SARC_06051 [Sphaeroforma arctica JP610]|eukprot:XP_014155530.1 hypothetical protein SARC_06051 [Sphaeroforma arctica JP610]